MDGRGSGSEGQDCFPLPQGLAQQPVPRPDDDRPKLFDRVLSQPGMPGVGDVVVTNVRFDVSRQVSGDSVQAS